MYHKSFRIESQVEVGKNNFKGIEYETWSDIKKLNSGFVMIPICQNSCRAKKNKMSDSG